MSVFGFDIDQNRIEELRAKIDRSTLSYESDPEALAAADFSVVAVSTPIDAWYRLDLSALVVAWETVGRVLQHGDIVVYSRPSVRAPSKKIVSPCSRARRV